MLDVENLSVSLGSKRILHDVDMQAPAGAVTAIIGPNGSGKTTLLRAVAGDIGYSGRASINGVDIASARPWDLAGMRAVLPQSASLSFPFTVREIVRLGLHAGTEALTHAHGGLDLPARALAAVDLAGFEGRFYQELSGGEQQRVQLARVLCQVWEPVADGVPRYLFLDEPVSSLDIKHQIQIMGIARDYAAAGGGVLAIMHDLNLTAMFADHVIMLSRGRVHAAGRAGEVITSETVSAVYECALTVGKAPAAGQVFVLPHGAAETAISRT